MKCDIFDRVLYEVQQNNEVYKERCDDDSFFFILLPRELTNKQLTCSLHFSLEKPPLRILAW